MQNTAKAESRRLLRVLFLRIGRLSSYSRAARLLSLSRRIVFKFLAQSTPELLPATTLIKIPQGLGE